MTDNLHPADELLRLRNDKAAIESRIGELRDMLIDMTPAERAGREARAKVTTQQRSRLDHKAIVYEMGQKWVDEHSTQSEVNIVRVEPLT